MLLGARSRPTLPVSLLGVAVATAAAALGDLDVATIGAIPDGLPAPSLPSIDPSHLGALLLPAVAVAGLAALESLLSASVADAMSVDERHSPDP